MATIVDDAHGHHVPTQEQREHWEELVQQSRESSIRGLEELRKEKEETRGKKDTPEAERKRRERQEKKALKLASKAGASPNETAETDSLAALLTPDEPATTSKPAAVSTPKDIGYPAHTIIIPATAEDHPWFQPPVYETLEAARVAGVWNYPTTPIQRARCAVFRDLIEKGYFIGGGMKFGGDWLVYPGALHNHASCQDVPETPHGNL